MSLTIDTLPSLFRVWTTWPHLGDRHYDYGSRMAADQSRDHFEDQGMVSWVQVLYVD